MSPSAHKKDINVVFWDLEWPLLCLLTYTSEYFSLTDLNSMKNEKDGSYWEAKLSREHNEK